MATLPFCPTQPGVALPVIAVNVGLGRTVMMIGEDVFVHPLLLVMVTVIVSLLANVVVAKVLLDPDCFETPLSLKL